MTKKTKAVEAVEIELTEGQEEIKKQYDTMLEMKDLAVKAGIGYQEEVFNFCLSVFQKCESKEITQAEIAQAIDQTAKSVSLFFATGMVFAEFDGFAEFSELSPELMPSQVKELAQDRKLGVKGLKDLVNGSEDILDLVKDLDKNYKKPEKKGDKKQNRAKKENNENPAVTPEQALNIVLTFINNSDDAERLTAFRDSLVQALAKRFPAQKSA